ncbi:MAG: NRDE family protein [Woeseiaceae bacterium]|nr:NRDE family protein [Woeseiaceae bacterium]
MCLVLLAFQASADDPLILAANRDEFHARPTREAHWWPDARDTLAGRDLQAGGTWLGVSRSGRFATVTNHRDARPPTGQLESRGRLVAEFLQNDQAPLDYLRSIDTGAFAGFNLLVGNTQHVGYLSNRGGGIRELSPGLYGLSNATLDTPWEKVERSKLRLADIVADGAADDASLLRLLGDSEKGPASEVRDEELPFEVAHAITAPFIVTPDYGTRCSTIVRAEPGGRWHFLERRFAADGGPVGDSQFSFGGVENAD